MTHYNKAFLRAYKAKIRLYKKDNPYLYKKYKLSLKMSKIYNFLYKKCNVNKMALKWFIYDFFCGKWFNRKLFGVYSFVALPGEGKTLSMIMHIERQLEKNPNAKVYTNFGYRKETAPLNHWSDIVKYSIQNFEKKETCIIAFDEMHLTFPSQDRYFPMALNTVLSFDRKLHVQFLCSSQIYDNLHKRVRDLTNYVVVCKNVFKLDRKFRNYYFDKCNYDAKFDGERRSATFIRDFVATDAQYRLYETSKLIKQLTSEDEKEKMALALDYILNSTAGLKIVE